MYEIEFKSFVLVVSYVIFYAIHKRVPCSLYKTTTAVKHLSENNITFHITFHTNSNLISIN